MTGSPKKDRELELPSSQMDSKKSRSLYNPDEPPYIQSKLELANPIQEQTRHRLRLMVFPKTKIPYVDLPHGMKNILYRSHRRNFDDEGNVMDSKGLSEKWHVNTTTMLNTEVYEQWKRNWLNGKLDGLKEEVRKKEKVNRDWGPVNDVFRDRKAKKIRRMRALEEFRHTGRQADNFRPSLDADE